MFWFHKIYLSPNSLFVFGQLDLIVLLLQEMRVKVHKPQDVVHLSVWMGCILPTTLPAI